MHIWSVFFGSLKSECLDKLILFGGTATRRAVGAFLVHYHTERNHQGLVNELIVPLAQQPNINAEIETTERLGGLLRSYRRAAQLVRISLPSYHNFLITNVISAARWVGSASLFGQRRAA
jgi:hypothetical protein